MKHSLSIRFRRIVIVIAGILACLIWFAGCRKKDITAYIGGYAITKEHLELYENDCKAKVSGYFYQTYQQDPNEEGFWEMEIRGEKPSQMLAEEAMAKLEDDMVERIEARKHGIETDITLKEVRKSLNKENKRRVRNKETIYGLNQYGIMEYLSKTQKETRDSLMEKLIKQELKPSTEDLQELYDKADPSFIRKGKRAVVGTYLYYGMKVGQFPDDLKDVWPYIKKEVLEGVSPETAVISAKERYGFDIVYEKVSFDASSIPRDHRALEWLVSQTDGLETGAWSEVVELEAAQGILYMIESKDYGVASFEEARGLMESMWIREKYPLYLEMKKQEYIK